MKIYPRDIVYKIMFISKGSHAPYSLISVDVSHKVSKIYIFIVGQILSSSIFFLICDIIGVIIASGIAKVGIFKEKVALIVCNISNYLLDRIFFNKLIVDKMHVNWMGTSQKVDEVPIFGCSYCRVLTFPMVKQDMPIYGKL